jgi:hypothetical protein
MNFQPSRRHGVPSILLFAAVVSTSISITMSQAKPATTQPISPAASIASTAATTAPSADGPITAALQKAKVENKAALARAREELAEVIDKRISAAADKGDLNSVEALQRMKSSIAPGQPMPADVKDDKVISAKNQYDKEANSANETLAAAYRLALHDYTRARKFSEAETAQNEAKASGLDITTVPVAAVRKTVHVLRTINLISLVDPGRDVVQGNWRIEDGNLFVQSGDAAQLDFPYIPPAEYDFTADVTRSDPKYAFALMFSHGDRDMALGLTGYSGHHGFSFKSVGDPRGATSAPIKRGQNYKFRIEVRNSSLKAYLDGKCLLDVATDYRNVQPDIGYFHATRRLALGDFWSDTEFRNVEVVERSGPGTYLPVEGGEPHDIPAKAMKVTP